MSETLVRLRYFAVVCLISSYYLVCYYCVIIIIIIIIIFHGKNIKVLRDLVGRALPPRLVGW